MGLSSALARLSWPESQRAEEGPTSDRSSRFPERWDGTPASVLTKPRSSSFPRGSQGSSGPLLPRGRASSCLL